MKNTSLIILALSCIVLSLASCDDTTDTLGMSLTENVNNITVNADSFTVESHSVAAKDIVSRSSNGYLGNIKDPETNSYVTCNYMTQFNTLGNYQFPGLDTILVENYDETKPKIDQIKAESCELLVFFSNFYGDSLALMKVAAHELATPYEESSIYKTDFDPIQENMVRTGDGSIHSEMSYTISNRLHADNDRWSSNYTPYISISLNDEYTDKDGKTYNNYGTYIMRKFFDPSTHDIFNNSYRFNHEICPGFYIQNVGGIGSLATINIAQVRIHFKAVIDGKESSNITTLSGTEEVLRKTNIAQNTAALDNLINNDPSCTYLKTPAGIFTELALPIEDIMLGRDDEVATHENDTLSTVRLFIPRVNDNKSTSYNLPIPKTLLLLPTDSVSTFFANQKVADSRTSYLSSYSSSTNGYTFGNISSLVTSTYKVLEDTISAVIAAKKQELGVQELPAELAKTIKKEVADKFMNDHPTWNKVMVIPVQTTYSTLSSGSSLLTKVVYDMSLGNTRLLKGGKDSDNIRVNVIYSKFKN